MTAAHRALIYGLWLATALVLSAPAHAAVGRTAGAAAVSPSGEAQYTVPIFAPPGTAGMTAQLALTYGSRGGDALLGVGWSVAGLSAIYRCNRTWAQDGVPFNVLNEYTDRFCRDGLQLKLESGAYGQNGARYRTEIETFARITSSGTAGNGPASFTVEQKDGLIYEYGTRSDSQIEAQGQSTVRTWALTTIRDRAGNRIEFYYNEDTSNGSYQIAWVEYTANSAASLTAAYKIEFTYETQPAGEIESGYLGGSVIKDIKRMTQVEVKHNSTLVRRYTIAYEGSLSSAGRSRLASITECAGSAGTECFAPTTFTYQNGTPGLASETSTGLAAPTGVPSHTMDVNGDGRLDLVYSSNNISGGGTNRDAEVYVAGYSRGGNTAVQLVNQLSAMGIGTSGLLTFDPHKILGSLSVIGATVGHAPNFYQTNPHTRALGIFPTGQNPYRGSPVQGAVNIHLGSDVNHLNIIYSVSHSPYMEMVNETLGK